MQVVVPVATHIHHRSPKLARFPPATNRLGVAETDEDGNGNAKNADHRTALKPEFWNPIADHQQDHGDQQQEIEAHAPEHLANDKAVIPALSPGRMSEGTFVDGHRARRWSGNHSASTVQVNQVGPRSKGRVHHHGPGLPTSRWGRARSGQKTGVAGEQGREDCAGGRGAPRE